MAWPPTDDFSDVSATTMSGKADDAGNTWTWREGSVAQVSSGRGNPNNTSATVCTYTNTATPDSADYQVSTDIYCVTDTNATSAGVLLRFVDTGNYYLIRYNMLNDVVQITTRIAGVGTDRVSVAVTALTAGQAGVIRGRVVGSTITAYWNDEWIGEWVDTTLTGAGLCGFRTYGNASNAAGPQFDTFAASAIPALSTARPTSDISAGAWTTQAGGTTNLYTVIDETIADDTDYVQSSLSPVSADVVEVALGSLTDPALSTDHALTYRYGKDLAGGDPISLTVSLVEGTAVLASWTHTNIADGYTTVTKTLTLAQAASIVNYANLRVRFSAIAP